MALTQTLLQTLIVLGLVSLIWISVFVYGVVIPWYENKRWYPIRYVYFPTFSFLINRAKRLLSSLSSSKS